MKPRDEKQLAEAVRSAKAPFEVLGLGTKRALGRPVEAQKLDLSAFKGVIAYEPEELILECGAATKLSEIEKLLANKNQMLAFEPPDFSKLLGSSHAGSVGGALACNLAGPRRLKAGAARDHILGVTGVNGQGELIRAGARVVKNVTGYDVPRLVAGSFGTLMAFTSVIFKVLPKPETEQTLRFVASSLADSISLMSKAMQSNAEISSAAFMPAGIVYLRLEGIAASVTYRKSQLQSVLCVAEEVFDFEESQNIWRNLGMVAPLTVLNDVEIWRVVLPQTDAPAFLAALPFEHKYFLDWAGSVIWLAVKPGTNVRMHLKSGVATLYRGDEKMRTKAEVFHPQAPALAALSARVKSAFDPKGLLNPGKMYREF